MTYTKFRIAEVETSPTRREFRLEGKLSGLFQPWSLLKVSTEKRVLIEEMKLRRDYPVEVDVTEYDGQGNRILDYW